MRASVCAGLAVLAFVLPLGCATVDGQAPPLDRIKLPPGFSISIFARDVINARSLALGAKGTIFVGTRTDGRVYAVVDENRDGTADRVHTIARRLNMPNGVAFREGALYVAEVNRVLRFDDIEANLADPPRPVTVSDAFPSEKHHGWKFIAFGPDDLLYVPIGAPCNICNEGDPYATIMRMRADGSGLEVFARGVRNTVGFDWHPVTRALWFTDNGRDWMGDNRPPDELNVAPRAGLHFGYPFCHGRSIPDPEFASERQNCRQFEPPVEELGPHVAAIGMRFYTGTMFPEEYRNQIFIAEHGSWNRSTPIGYRLTLVRLDGDRAGSYEPFAEGWLQGSSAWGRPADVLVMPDGALLVSDDEANVIYRITYAADRQ